MERIVLVENKDDGGDAVAEEEIGGQADDGFQQVFLDELLADLVLDAPPEKNAVGNDDADAAADSAPAAADNP